ncbi:ABC transporter substrate-binding protein [soil metagenome]
MRTNEPTRRWWVLLLALALAVSACGGGDDTADTADTADTTDPAGPADATDADADIEADPEVEGDDAAAEGLDGEPIVIGAVHDLTGPTSDVGVPYAEGMRAYVDWRNTNGGVDGRPLQLNGQDYLYDVAVAEQLYSQFVSQGAVAFMGWGTGDTEALRVRVNTDEIPFMSASLSEQLVDPAETPYNFVVGLTYSQQMRVALQHIADTAGGPAEVVVFHHDSPFGESPLDDGREFIETNGLDIDYRTIAMPGGATDYTGELAQAGGPDYVIIQNVVTPGSLMVRDIGAQGLDATVVCLNFCADELLVELAGDDAEGVLGVMPFATPASAADDLGDVVEHLESQGRTLDDIDLHWTQGWYTMAVMVAGIEQVVTSGEEVTGPAVRDALEALEPFETPVTIPIDFSADSHAGMSSGQVFEVQGGEWVPLSDVITP